MISVVVPVIRADLYPVLRHHLTRQTLVPGEIIPVFDKERKGPCWARETGILKASGDLIALIDDDCLPQNDDWLAAMRRVMKRHDADFVSGTYFETDPFLMERRARKNYPSRDTVNPIGVVGIGGNILTKKSCLLECRKKDGYMYNPIFGTYGAEDIELVWRLKEYGFKTVYSPIGVRHLKRITFMQYQRQQFSRGIGIAILDGILKSKGFKKPPQKSILWGNKWYQKPGIRWVAAFSAKFIGPLDNSSFSCRKYFIQFWLGEKMMALGYLYARLGKHPAMIEQTRKQHLK